MVATNFLPLWWAFLIVVSLPSSKAIVCHSNVRDTAQEEDCGPGGYCFFQDISTDHEAYYRGCDHVFMCELLIESNVSQPSSSFNESKAIKVDFKWCGGNVPYVGVDTKRRDGIFCCCDTDFCNRDEPNEEDQPYHKVQHLISGTKEDYEELKKLAKKFRIPTD